MMRPCWPVRTRSRRGRFKRCKAQVGHAGCKAQAGQSGQLNVYVTGSEGGRVPGSGGDGGESNSPSRAFSRGPLRAYPMFYRHPPQPASAPFAKDQSRPLSGFASDYVTLLRSASPLNDASTVHGDETASTLTLLPKQRGREQAGGCQLLLLPPFYEARRHLGSRSSGIRPCRDHASPRGESYHPNARSVYPMPADRS